MFDFNIWLLLLKQCNGYWDLYCLAAFKCPYSTFKYDFNNQAGFTTTLETPVGDQPGDDALRGSGDSVPMTPDDELVIECDKNSKAFTVMELEFNVEPDAGQPTVATVVFTLEDGSEVVVTKTVSTA